ncbi:non-specific phospholipase C3 [Eucalyptus grandis]|uniref:non-specific phospholipase C3 n=1 Tax=Eucalyptus grandis TaxID=71139 RepID=UPI00192EC520|nr:non-specific phospholipase C3 [Eucalyptus grandis]
MVSESSTAAAQACPIKTVVVLVQENRSFDHMLGWMKSLNPDIDGVDGTQSNPLSVADSNSLRVTFGNSAVYVDPDPDHSFQAIYEQVFGEPWDDATSPSKNLLPAMEGFAQNAERKQQGLSEFVMNGFRPEAVPVYKELASEFAVCDRWFASIPASTQPNRLYVHAATSCGAMGNDTQKLVEGYPQRTVFESMHEAGHSFGIYYAYPPSTLFYRNLRKPKYLKHFHQFDLHFKRHAKEGKLPNYTVIEQRYFELSHIPGNDDHPSHDISEGQKFVKEVYEALRSSPQWNEILFVIVYDEHGGFYDHVPTPVEGVPSPDGIVGPAPYSFNFDRLGVRVPAILVSPWIEPGTVLHEPSGPYPTSQFEHSSIPATVKKIFNLPSFLTKRDEWAGTFDVVLNLNRTSPRTDCPVTLPDPAKLRESGPKEAAQLNDFQEQLVQLAATMNGDHKKDIYPHKLVENMTVVEAAKYVESAFEMFCRECEGASENGSNDAGVDSQAEESTRPASGSFFQRLFSCVICDH